MQPTIPISPYRPQAAPARVPLILTAWFLALCATPAWLLAGPLFAALLVMAAVVISFWLVCGRSRTERAAGWALLACIMLATSVVGYTSYQKQTEGYTWLDRARGVGDETAGANKE